MDLEFITFLALILTCVGKPVEVNNPKSSSIQHDSDQLFQPNQPSTITNPPDPHIITEFAKPHTRTFITGQIDVINVDNSEEEAKFQLNKGEYIVGEVKCVSSPLLVFSKPGLVTLNGKKHKPIQQQPFAANNSTPAQMSIISGKFGQVQVSKILTVLSHLESSQLTHTQHYSSGGDFENAKQPQAIIVSTSSISGEDPHTIIVSNKPITGSHTKTNSNSIRKTNIDAPTKFDIFTLAEMAPNGPETLEVGKPTVNQVISSSFISGQKPFVGTNPSVDVASQLTNQFAANVLKDQHNTRKTFLFIDDEPVAIVTATTANHDGTVAPVNGREPVTIVIATNINGDSQLSTTMSTTSKASDEEEEEEEPVEVVLASNVNGEMQSSFAEFAIPANLSSTEKPRTVITASTPSVTPSTSFGAQKIDTGEKSNNVVNNLGQMSSQEFAASSTSASLTSNKQKPISLMENNRNAGLINQFFPGMFSASSSSSNQNNFIPATTTSLMEIQSSLPTSFNNLINQMQSIKNPLKQTSSRNFGGQSSSASISSIDEDKSVTDKTINRVFAGVNSMGQTSSSVNGQKFVITSHGPDDIFTTTNNSAVNREKPITTLAESNSHIDLINNKKNQFSFTMSNPFGQLFPGFGNSAQNAFVPKPGFFNQINNRISSNLVTSSQQSSSSAISTDSATGKVSTIEQHSSSTNVGNGNKTSSVFISSSSVNGQKPITVITNHGDVLTTTENSVVGTQNLITVKETNFNSGMVNKTFGNLFPGFGSSGSISNFGQFFLNIPSSGGQSMDSTSLQGQVTTTHQSSASTISTDSTGHVTQIQQQSSSTNVGGENKPSSIFISSSSVNGQKPHIVVITSNPNTGELIQLDNTTDAGVEEDSSVESDFSFSNITKFPVEANMSSVENANSSEQNILAAVTAVDMEESQTDVSTSSATKLTPATLSTFVTEAENEVKTEESTTVKPVIEIGTEINNQNVITSSMPIANNNDQNTSNILAIFTSNSVELTTINPSTKDDDLEDPVRSDFSVSRVTGIQGEEQVLLEGWSSVNNLSDVQANQSDSSLSNVMEIVDVSSESSVSVTEEAETETVTQNLELTSKLSTLVKEPTTLNEIIVSSSEKTTESPSVTNEVILEQMDLMPFIEEPEGATTTEPILEISSEEQVPFEEPFVLITTTSSMNSVESVTDIIDNNPTLPSANITENLEIIEISNTSISEPESLTTTVNNLVTQTQEPLLAEITTNLAEALIDSTSSYDNSKFTSTEEAIPNLLEAETPKPSLNSSIEEDKFLLVINSENNSSDLKVESSNIIVPATKLTFNNPEQPDFDQEDLVAESSSINEPIRVRIEAGQNPFAREFSLTQFRATPDNRMSKSAEREQNPFSTFSVNEQPGETTIITRDPSIGAITQTRYIYPSFVNYYSQEENADRKNYYTAFRSGKTYKFFPDEVNFI